MLRALLTQVDRISERVLLWVNLVLACFVGLAHGGALAISYQTPTPLAGEIRTLAAVSLPLATVVIVTAVTGLLRTNLRRVALAIHGLVLAGAAVVMVLLALTILLNGIPDIPDGYFVWSLGLMSVAVCYSAFVASRYSVPIRLRAVPAVFYAPIFALAIAVPIDVGVFIQLTHELTRRFG